MEQKTTNKLAEISIKELSLQQLKLLRMSVDAEIAIREMLSTANIPYVVVNEEGEF